MLLPSTDHTALADGERLAAAPDDEGTRVTALPEPEQHLHVRDREL